jgi:uncharacterized protein (DUF849 family)
VKSGATTAKQAQGMSRPVVITCAITGGADTVGKHPSIPVTPQEIAQSALEAATAGAAIVHIHVRDPSTGRASLDTQLFREVFERIRERDSEVLINLTTGEGGLVRLKQPAAASPDFRTHVADPAIRAAHIEHLRPDMCSLDMGSLNFGDDLFVNSASDIVRIADIAKSADVCVELEVFDTGHIRFARHLIEKGKLAPRAVFQLCLGIPWGAPATIETMLHMRGLLPKDTVWGAFGIGSAQFPMVASAVLLGGNVRVGLEDNLYLERGVFAPSNAALVERAVRMVESLGARAATRREAREIIGIIGPPRSSREQPSE